MLLLYTFVPTYCWMQICCTCLAQEDGGDPMSPLTAAQRKYRPNGDLSEYPIPASCPNWLLLLNGNRDVEKRHRGGIGICPISLRILSLLRFVDSRKSLKFPMDMGIPPLRIISMLQSNPLKSRIVVRRLAVLTPTSAHRRAVCAEPVWQGAL